MANKKGGDDLDLGIEQEGGSKKKMLILIAVGVLVLLGGGLGAGFFLFGGDAATEEEGDGKAAAETGQEEQMPPIYQALSPAFVVNLPPGGRVKMLQIGVDVMARDPALIAFLKHNDPMIRNHLLNLFGTQQGEALRSREGKEKLQAEVLKTLNRIIGEQGGPGEVEAVYFTSFVMQ
ncbi:MAG TPA: flagellar basal body-associated FliL family protein [Sedimenticola thiotaurini]|uniref:Flagellar protein FliL n=1 Tax=Sedimenticola thiotaurini TaxID=1543721 RepID=A0A831RJW4_9GAMM|nr:flagellar basal body-associated FliL family protein [Sedimenticola thiotaurini]